MAAQGREGYSRLQLWLHWLTVLGIAGAWFTGGPMGRVLEARIRSGETGLDGATPHTVLGGAIFALALIRIAARAVQGAPAPVAGGPAWQAGAAVWGHRLLYLLLFVVPALGMAAWFGHRPAAGAAHEVAVNLLLLVALGHALMAFYHHYALRDGTLSRMMRRG